MAFRKRLGRLAAELNRRPFALSELKAPDGAPKRCFPHMFRSTFAVEMLLAGVPLEQVSMLLGLKSVKITEKHYAPWVKARPEQLEANVRQAWKVDRAAFKASCSPSPNISR